MKPNPLRQKLNAGYPTIGTRVQNLWPSIVELIGKTETYDYVEFLAEDAPYDPDILDSFCCAVETFEMSSIIKVDPEQRAFLAQSGISAGCQGIFFSDINTAEEAHECVSICRPNTLDDGSHSGIARQDTVVMIMIEKQSAVEQLDEILAVKGIDMIQWGPVDYSMNINQPEELDDFDVNAAEQQVIKTALAFGVAPRVEIGHPSEARYYTDMGVRHFSLGVDISILFDWWQDNGGELRCMVGDR